MDISKLPYQAQLAETEWWSREKLLAHQFQQIAILLEHAYKTIPHYRQAIDDAGLVPGRPIDLVAWRRLPPLTRRDVQRLGAALHSTDAPESHGEFLTTTTSGSTGMPVTVLGTELDAYFSKAFQLRLNLWCRLDFSKKLAFIHKLPSAAADGSEGIDEPSWGDEATYPFPTGPSAALDVAASIDRQIEWLERQRPAYLSVYPSILAAILQDYEGQRRGPPGVELVLTLGEVLEPELRAACRRIWRVPVFDNYSAMEVGPIAFQCPEHEHYHVQAESALVEVVDESGDPVPPGATGRVLVTPLHNFAMPLLRYEIGDYAEPGGPCPCGRGLPVLRRILGRTRNMLVTPDGRRYWPTFGNRQIPEVAPVVQHQFVQVGPTTIEARLVAERPLTDDECARFTALVRSRLPYPFDVRLRFVDSIPRSPSHKFEFFRCEL
jgi:phenylacetate-CoA ligase